MRDWLGRLDSYLDGLKFDHGPARQPLRMKDKEGPRLATQFKGEKRGKEVAKEDSDVLMPIGGEKVREWRGAPVHTIPQEERLELVR